MEVPTGDYDRVEVAVSTISMLAWIAGAIAVLYTSYLAVTGQPVLRWAYVSLGLLLVGATFGAFESALRDRNGD